jgi:hypothetical protein
MVNWQNGKDNANELFFSTISLFSHFAILLPHRLRSVPYRLAGMDQDQFLPHQSISRRRLISSTITRKYPLLIISLIHSLISVVLRFSYIKAFLPLPEFSKVSKRWS